MANEFVARNGLIAQANSEITGSLIVTGGITGSFSGTSSYAQNTNLLDGLDSTQFTQTGSFNSYTSSLNNFSASILLYTSSLSAKTASFATTGSNRFNGNQTITGSLTVTQPITGSLFGTASVAENAVYSNAAGYADVAGTADTASYADNFTVGGTLTAQTIIVQTVTSSIVYSSGSNKFGNNINNTQVFTGSVTVTGSLTVNGSSAILSNQTSSMSASYAVSSTSASYALNADLLDGIDSTRFANTSSLNTLSSSFNSYTSSLNSFSASILNYTSSQNTLNGTFATTGSNRFNGNQIITGSLTVSQPITGSLFGTASFVTTASYALTAQTLLGSVTSASYALSASYAITASNADLLDGSHLVQLTNTSSFNALSSSYNAYTGSINAFSASIFSYTQSLSAKTASFATTGSNRFNGNQTITGSLTVTQPITGSLFGTASYATTASYALTAQTLLGSVTSASYALTASFALNAGVSSINTSSFAITGSNRFNGNQIITGSLTVFSGSSVDFQVTDTGTKIGATISDNHTVTGSLLVTGSITTTGTLTAQTLVVQTVSSSVVYSSGSNNFGNNITNVQSFTGSLRVTGSGNHYILGGNFGVGTSNVTHKLVSYVPTMNAGADIDYPLFASVAGKGVVLGFDTANDTAIISGVHTGTAWKNLCLNSNSGNVGIGVTSPGTLLTLNSINNDKINFQNSGTSIATIGTTTTNDFYLYHTATSTFPLWISGSTNIGIGTTSPDKKLDVFGTIQARPLNNSPLNSAWYVIGSISEVSEFGVANGIVVENNGTNSYAMTFGTKTSNATGITEKVRITANGSVGINTTSSLYKLDVNGTTRIQSRLTIGSGEQANAPFEIYVPSANALPTAIIGGNSGGASIGNYGGLSIYNNRSSGLSEIELVYNTSVGYFSIGNYQSSTYKEQFKINNSGQFKFNQYTSSISWTGSAVANLAVDSSGNVITVSTGSSSPSTVRVVETFTATAGQTTFTITGGYTVGTVDVYLNGVYLDSSEYTASNGTTVVLSTAAVLNDIITVIKFSGSTATLTSSQVTTALAYTPANIAPPISTKTGSYTLALADAGTVIEMNVGSANTVTIPPNSSVPFPTNTEIQVLWYGSGQTSIATGSGVTARSNTGYTKIGVRYAGVTLKKRATDEWYIVGNLSA